MTSAPAIAERELAADSLLAALPADSLASVSPHLEAVELRPQQTVHEIGGRVTHAHFPAAGCVLAGVAIMSDGATVETALVGREGVAGLAALFADGRARHWTRALLPGAALRLPADALHELFARDEAARLLLLGSYRALLAQATRRAVCNARHHLFARLCTWLLTVRARAGRDDLPLTQEAIARQLGVRRAGVNEAVGRLERAGVV
ncbi:MAG TPA: Crp/Fnr family transcriptional regulator, partial [Pyrinomonadaceae bacterium]|nr:Crp/Fnr family transcriptional regulator [Pyrinomonadaceae bacterium]